MLFAPTAIFLHLETLGIVALVLLYGVVATLALGARESNQCTHFSSSNVTQWDTLPPGHCICQHHLSLHNNFAYGDMHMCLWGTGDIVPVLKQSSLRCGTRAGTISPVPRPAVRTLAEPCKRLTDPVASWSNQAKKPDTPFEVSGLCAQLANS